MKDIQFRAEGGMFNCRAVGVCIKDNRIFLSKLKSDDYWTFVGGKVGFGESTDAAIVREYQEETGAELKAERLLAVIENFFEMDESQWHQYIFFYLLSDDKNILELFEGERQIADHDDAVYKWFYLSELDDITIKPACSREVLRELSPYTKHYINRDSDKKGAPHAT